MSRDVITTRFIVVLTDIHFDVDNNRISVKCLVGRAGECRPAVGCDGHLCHDRHLVLHAYRRTGSCYTMVLQQSYQGEQSDILKGGFSNLAIGLGVVIKH